MANVKQIKQKTTGTLLDIEDTQARSDIASEVTNRTNADTTLQAKIDNEVTARTNSDNTINQKITSEITNRTNADKALDDKVKAETEARTSADNALNQKIAQETTNRTNADNALQEKINTNKNDISELKGDLNSLDSRMVPVVKYTNWFDHTAEVTSGYFLNYTNGNPVPNANYGYSDYYPIKKDTDYYANGFGNGAQFCFYNLSKNFISGVLLNNGSGTFRTPTNCAYIRYSVALNLITNPITVTEGTSVGVYTPYEFIGYETIKSRTLEVGAEYQYKTVMSAVNDAIDGDIVFIHCGTYDNEVVDASKKTISVIGEDRDRVIIKNDLGTYTKPPLQMASGLLKNVTLIAVDGGKPSTDADGTRPYALHCDYDILAGKSFRVENCILRSWLNSGVGFGLRLDGKISFDNCVIESKGQRVALFGHDSANSELSGNQYLSIKDCIIEASNYNYAVRFDSQRMADANVYLTLINNTIVDTNETPNSTYNNVGTGSGTSIYNFNNLINYHNDKKSHGNTMSNWNYIN